MRPCIRALVVAVLVCLASPASESPFDIVPPPFNLDSELLQVASDLQLPGGAVLPAGAYRVVIRQQLLKYVARPDASLGYWPGPAIQLWPSERPMLSQLPLFYFALKTATEVSVVYDLPFKQPPDPSLGYWPGPAIQLWPAQRSLRPDLSFYFSLKTAREAKVIYDLPFKQAPGNKRVGLPGRAWTPLVRNGQLIGLTHRSQTLRVTDARRAAAASRQ